MTTELLKARGERARIEALLAGAESSIRRAFRRFLDDVRSEAVRQQVRIALEQGSIEVALRVVDAHVQRFGGVLTQVFQAAGIEQASVLAARLPRSRAHVAVTFDPTWPRAAEIMRRNKLEFVQGFTRSQREATRAALVESFQTGAGPKETARAFRNSIGLTERQRRAVGTYRGLLEAGDKEALTRDLRDRRFDSSVARAAEFEEPLGAARIDNMVERYQDRYLQYRAETIARTEGLRTSSLAQQEALDQVLEQVEMPRDSVVRIWRATQDKRTRDTHAEMDGQERDLLTPFDSPSGARLMYPGDPTAPIGEIINCRCVLLNEFR